MTTNQTLVSNARRLGCHTHSSRVRMVRIISFERYVRILTYLIEGYVKGTVHS